MSSVSSTTIQINTTGSANGSALVSPPSPPASSSSPPSAGGDNMSLSGAAPPTSSTSPPASPPSPPAPSSPNSSASSPPPSSSASPPSPPPPSSSSPPPTPPAPSKAKAPPEASPPPAPASSSGSSPPSPPPTPPASPPPSPPQSSAPSGSPPPPDQLSPPPPPAPASGTGAVPAPAISPPPPTSSTGPSPPIASTSPPPPSAPTASGSPPATPTNSTPTTNSGSTPPSQTSSRIPTSTSNSTSGGSSTPSSSTPSSSTPTVVGAAVAGVFVVALIALVVLVLQRKKRKEGAFASKYVPPSSLSPQSDKYYYGQQSHMMGGTGHSGPYYGSQGQNSSIENSFGSQRGGGNMYHGGGGDSSVITSSKSFFTYEELMEITNGFSHQNIIGEGGFGCVYKGWLSDGKLVAVKQLKAGSGQGDREFKAEVEIISRVHHRHLVSLVGYSIAENQRLLIYEFVPNKTLEHHLHGKGLPVLEWTKRVKIALGSAKGLAYLHEDCHPKIIHRDIKSANILLDDAFEAQVADFGLAKLTNDANTHVSTRVMGTFGYLAPEYASSGKLTDRSDVFSFGVVLLELITGRKPVDATQPLGDESLVEWARPLLLQALETGDPSELVDPRLEKNYVEGEMFRMIEAAAACIRHSAAKRPRMVQVVRALDSEGDMSDLTNGVKYGQSTVYDSGQYSEDIMKFRRMALGSGDSSDYGPYSGDYSSREVSGAQKIPWKSRDSSNEFTSGESETRAMNPLNSEKRFPGAQGGHGVRRFS